MVNYAEYFVYSLYQSVKFFVQVQVEYNLITWIYLKMPFLCPFYQPSSPTLGIISKFRF